MISQPSTVAPPATHDAAPPADPAADITLAVVDREHVDAINAFYRRRSTIETTLAGRAATIATTWPIHQEEPSSEPVINLRIDDADGKLVVPRPLLDALIQTIDPSLSLDRLDAKAAGLLIEFALSDPLAAIETCVGCRLELASVGAASRSNATGEWLAIAFKLVLDGLGISTLRLWLSPADTLRLAHGLDQHCRIEKISMDLPVAVCLRAAAARLTVGELKRLAAGDVVLAHAESRPDGTAIAVIGEHLVAPVQIMPMGSQLSARPVPGRESPWEWSMDRIGEGTEAAALTDSELEGLPVRLVFEVGRVELPLGAIAQLAPGAVIPLARSPDEPVDIVANGRRLGRGTLLRIGPSLGVRIVSLAGND